ncbi:MAG: hypothetical protein ACRD4L_07970 [Pyrinomonadaceae bacterium]
MPRLIVKKHKHFILEESKIRHAQRLLGAQTEKETIERALEEVIVEHERNKQAWTSHKRFLKNSIIIRDVYGVLTDSD